MSCPATHPACQHTRETDYQRYGCRCPAARADRERWRKQAHLLPARLVDATGTRRRLQALMAMGWPSRELAERLGRPSGALGPLLWGPRRHEQVTRALHERVKEIYDELWHLPGPSAETARRAARKAWPTPLGWDDDRIDDPTHTPMPGVARATSRADVDPVAVELACQGRAQPLTMAERREVVRRLHAQGLSDGAIAARGGITARTVLRIRQELALPAVAA